MSHERTTRTNKSNYDSEETENYSRMLSDYCGEHPEESAGVFDRPAE